MSGRFARAPSRGLAGAQGSGPFDPAAAVLLPEVPLDVLALAEHAPRAACGVDGAIVEEQESARKAEPLVAPAAIGEGDEAGLVLGRASAA